jgi:hypothetical protein
MSARSRSAKAWAAARCVPTRTTANSSQARYDVRIPQHAGEFPGNLLDDLVASRMAEAVVNHLKPVNIQHDNGQRVPQAQGSPHLLIAALGECTAAR